MKPFLMRVDGFDSDGRMLVSVNPHDTASMLTAAKGGVTASSGAGWTVVFSREVLFREAPDVPRMVHP